MAEPTEGADLLTCPRCNHKLSPTESHDEVAGVRTHRLQACFDYLKADYDKIKPPEAKAKAEAKKPETSEYKAYGLDEDEEDKESGGKAKKK